MNQNPLGTPEDTPWLIPFFFILITVLSCALFMNGIVIFIFISHRRIMLNNANNMLLFSMALADLMVSLMGIIGSTFFLLISSNTKVWKLGATVPQTGSYFISMFSVSLMTADRMISIRYALRYYAIVTNDRAKTVIISMWVVIALLTFIHLVIYIRASPERELTARSVFIAASFVIAGTILSISNLVLHKEVQTKQKARVQSGKSVDIKNTYMCIWLSILFLICCIPMFVCYVGFAVITSPRSYWLKFMVPVGFMFASLNCVFNPTVYFLKRRDFRKLLRQMFTKNVVHVLRSGTQSDECCY